MNPKLIEYLTTITKQLVNDDDRQAVFNDLSAQTAGFLNHDDLLANVRGPFETLTIDDEQVCVTLDFSRDVMIITFGNVYCSESDTYSHVMFEIDNDMNISQ